MAHQKRRTSLKDLAQELGVSIATVSRALHSSPEIGKEMQQRVKDLAKRLNYRPKPFALIGDGSGNIAGQALLGFARVGFIGE